MGKHKEKSKKHKKSGKRRHSSSSEDEWVEKPTEKSAESPQTEPKRDDWMSLSTSFSSTSHLDRRKERQNKKEQNRQAQQYNPAQCSRELNPYWKDGGDGLPKFQKPLDNWNTSSEKKSTETKTETLNLNEIAAKLVKAEIMGNTRLAKELKEKLEKAREEDKEDEVLLTQTDQQGRSRPLKYEQTSKKKHETHERGERVKYFADDDKYSLKEMFENEKFGSSDRVNREFVKMSGKVRKNDDFDDIFTDKIRRETGKNDDKHAIDQHRKISKSLDNCRRCLQSESMLKHLLVSMGQTAYLSLPSHVPLTENHCLLTSIRHVSCTTQLDENEWSEIMDFRKSLTNMFRAQDEDVIFFETATNLQRYPHFHINCIPLARETGDLAPIYFKKAIDESEYEWAQNKKLIPMQGKDVRRVVPKGLAYFWVSFGMQEGYAHIIEDERLFPANFAEEIIGGMLDLGHEKWRKPKQMAFEEQSRRALEFSKLWTNFDCTSK